MCSSIRFTINDFAGKEEKLMDKYEKPAMDVIEIKNEVITTSCESNNGVTNIGGNGGIGYGGGSNQPGR